MADPNTFVPIKQESIASIRARIDADANVGLTPDDDDYLDLSHGGFWWDLTQAPGLEMERLWDFATTELPAAVFVLYSYGEYLDDHGDAFGVTRKDQVAATGVVRFTGDPDVIIAPGTQVAAPTTELEAEEVTFEVVGEGDVIPAGGTLDLPVQAREPGAQSNVAALAVNLLMTPIDGIATVSNLDPISGGADVEQDDPLRERILLEMRAQGGGGTVNQFERWSLEYPGIGAVTVQPLPAGPGTVRVMALDMEGKPVSVQLMEGLQQYLDPPAADALSTGSHTLPLGGSNLNVDSTDGFRASGRVYLLNGQLVTYASKTATAFVNCQGGAGAVPAGTRVYQGGIGGGKATIGVDVVVGTPAIHNVTIAATIVFNPGYTLDGSPGTVAMRADLAELVADYVSQLDVGEDVVLNHVEARLFRAEQAVYDVTGTTINGAATNRTIGQDEVAVLQAVNLT